MLDPSFKLHGMTLGALDALYLKKKIKKKKTFYKITFLLLSSAYLSKQLSGWTVLYEH